MTDNKQQTAVEKYVSDIAKLDELFTSDKLTREEYFTKRRLAMVEANELHKEQVIDAHLCGQNSAEEVDGQTEIEYYEQNYGGSEQ
jgi:hypothetical protein